MSHKFQATFDKIKEQIKKRAVLEKTYPELANIESIMDRLKRDKNRERIQKMKKKHGIVKFHQALAMKIYYRYMVKHQKRQTLSEPIQLINMPSSEDVYFSKPELHRILYCSSEELVKEFGDIE